MTTNSPAARALTQDIAYIAVFAALIIATAFFSIGTASGVPIVLQNIMCILAGLILGPKRGFLAVALFLTLGMVGLPVLPGGRSVISALGGTTVGYLVGYLISPVVAGLIVWISPRNSKKGFTISVIVAIVVAVLIQYACGTVGLVLRGTELIAAIQLQFPYIPVDALKAAAATAITVGVHTALPDLRPTKKKPNPTAASE